MSRRRVSRGRKASKRRFSARKRFWKKATGRRGKYSNLGAVVRRRPGKRKHRKGVSWTGRKGTVALYSRRSGKLWATNPKRRGHRGRSHHRRGRNPGIIDSAKSMIIAPVMALPKTLPALFKTDPLRHGLFAGGGVLAGMIGGTALQSALLGVTGSLLPDAVKTAMSKGIVQRVVGASFALLAGGLVAKFGVKPGGDRTSFVTGTAAAALIEAIFPGALAQRLHTLPIVGPWIQLPASPVAGLAGLFGSDELAGFGTYTQNPAYQGVGTYTQNPAYQGVGAYVHSPAYQGVGRLGAYVHSPAYQGVGHLGASMDDAVAGLGAPGDNRLAGNLGAIGSNMPSHLDT
jgi:hypothetical protein